MACRGTCHRLDGYTKRLSDIHKDGRAFCPTCRAAYRTVAVFCACCNFRLRRSPRGGEARRKLVREASRI